MLFGFSFGLVDLDGLAFAGLIADRATGLASRLTAGLALAARGVATVVYRRFSYYFYVSHDFASVLLLFDYTILFN